MLEQATLRFLKALKKNNNREWFEKHRYAYEAARIDFQNFVYLLLKDLMLLDPTLADITAKDCLFRVNRDVRFSKDKSPYKTNFGASIKRDGKKSPYAGYYFHLEPGKSFAGGGMWMPDAAALKNMRQEIDYNWNEFSSLVEDKSFKKVFGTLYSGADMKLSSMPKGYEKENPAADYLKLKCFIAERPLSDEELLSGSLHKKTMEAFKALQPLLRFINRTISDED